MLFTDGCPPAGVVVFWQILFSTSLKFLYSYKWILLYTCTIFWYALDAKYLENETMHCHCRTDTSNTLNIHGLLETIGKTRCLGGFSVYCLTIQACHGCPWQVEHHMDIVSSNYYTTATKIGGGGILESPFPSVCLSVDTWLGKIVKSHNHFPFTPIFMKLYIQTPD